MSLVPSIRVDCPQCKKAFWVKLKKGTIPAAVVACPNCAFAWDLGQHTNDAIIQRSYAWDELITRIGLVFQPRKKSLPLADESIEQFREANTSSDSMEDWRVDLIELQVEPLDAPELKDVVIEEVEDLEVIPYSGQEVSEELGVAETPEDPEEELEDLLDEVEDAEPERPRLSLPPPRPGFGPLKLELPELKLRPVEKSAPTDGTEDDKSS